MPIATITTVYSDKWYPLFKAMGQVTINRATDVEHDGKEWIATLRSTGQVIARGDNRAEVIKAEVKYLNTKLKGQ